MVKKTQILSIVVITLACVGSVWSKGDKSLFTPEAANSPLARTVFTFLESNRNQVIDEWIRLTEIPSPSGYEEKRAAYMHDQFQSAGLEGVHIDAFGNVIGLWKGEPHGKNIIVSAHMDTVFQDVWEIKVKREANVLKAPGIGDDTASLINLLWSVRALKHAGFQPKNTYFFLATTGEEVGFVGMNNFLNTSEESFDLVLALDGDLGKVRYGALGFGGGKITFRGPGAHTMQSRGVPNPNLAVALAIDRLYHIHLLVEPLEKWTILNIGLIGGGKVRNAVSQESFFTIDLRSANQDELERVQGEIRRICLEVATGLGIEVEIDLNENSKAYQIPKAGESFLVRTVLDILTYLNVADIEADPLGSTEANVGIEKGILSVNLGRTYGRYKHSLREEADIDGLFLAMKQILLLLICLE
jgi:acetylornithine deacetylase/succinyl-diaminopimelate desuccinylase-like protein